MVQKNRNIQKLPPSHDRLVSDCFLWHWNTFPELRRTMFHPRNETPRYPGESHNEHMKRLAQAKGIGIVPGVMDLIWYYHGSLIAFDIKIGNDSISEAQDAFGAAIIAQGGQWHEIRSLEQFQSIITAIINPPCKSHTFTLTL